MQLKGFSPKCVSMQLFSWRAWVKEYLHCVQLKGLSPEWINMCFLRSLAVVQEKTSLQNGKACVSWGYQLLCRSSCTFCKWMTSLHYEPACVFSDEQVWWLSSHTGCSWWGFFLSCWTIYVLRSLAIVKERLHWTHELSVSSICISIVVQLNLVQVQSILEQSSGITRQTKNFSDENYFEKVKAKWLLSSYTVPVATSAIFVFIYFPLSYYKYNGGSSVTAPGRPSWMSSCLVSKMQR